MRYATQYILVDASDCDPPHGLDLQWKHDKQKVEMLIEAFRTNGFDVSQPALVGYPKDGRIQLLSGTHRHMAAMETGTQLPVKMWLRSDVEEMWGTELWQMVIKDIPVCQLELMEVKDGHFRSPYPAVDLSELEYE